MKLGLLKKVTVRLTVSIAMFIGVGINAAHAGIPVIDSSNLTQNVMTALQTAQQYAQQIQQYQTQLQQYETQIKNSVAPAAYLWDAANSTITKITSLVNQVNNLHSSQLDSYLSNFQNASFYSSSPCFKATGCSGTTYNQMVQNGLSASATTKQANDQLLKTLDQQQSQLQTDAANLSSMQNNATTAVGQMSAIQSANQLASATNNNLLQLRALILAQQQAAAAKSAADLDKQAKQDAASAYVHTATFTASPSVSY